MLSTWDSEARGTPTFEPETGAARVPDRDPPSEDPFGPTMTASRPATEDLLPRARELAREIAENPPLAVQGIKRVMNWSADHPTADGLAFVSVWNAAFLQSVDLGEALAAFAERRPPRFTGQ